MLFSTTPMRIAKEIEEAFTKARRITVLTGAGVSAESGVPTFRGSEGLWKNFRPEELATPEAFQKDPKLVWEWYDWRRSLIKPLKPNPGHYALVDIEKKREGFRLLTQNVDGLHRMAGSTNITELHGNIWKVRCCIEGDIFESFDTPLKELPPRCEKCGALLRPHIVWFGESLQDEDMHAALEAVDECDFMIVAGTSSVVQPAASLSYRALQKKAFVLEINPEQTPLSSVATASIQGKSGEILPLLAGLI